MHPPVSMMHQQVAAAGSSKLMQSKTREYIEAYNNLLVDMKSAELKGGQKLTVEALSSCRRKAEEDGTTFKPCGLQNVAAIKRANIPFRQMCDSDDTKMMKLPEGQRPQWVLDTIAIFKTIVSPHIVHEKERGRIESVNTLVYDSDLPLFAFLFLLFFFLFLFRIRSRLWTQS